MMCIYYVTPCIICFSHTWQGKDYVILLVPSNGALHKFCQGQTLLFWLLLFNLYNGMIVDIVDY